MNLYYQNNSVNDGWYYTCKPYLYLRREDSIRIIYYTLSEHDSLKDLFNFCKHTSQFDKKDVIRFKFNTPRNYLMYQQYVSNYERTIKAISSKDKKWAVLNINHQCCDYRVISQLIIDDAYEVI